ncbi:unnamed protein product [Urochloa humidicola]
MVGLPALVREIQRIDTIQLYAEATLQLEALVGNLEDVTFSIVRHASKLSLPSILWKSNERLVHLCHQEAGASGGCQRCGDL